jgi:hypothetical protein
VQAKDSSGNPIKYFTNSFGPKYQDGTFMRKLDFHNQTNPRDREGFGKRLSAIAQNDEKGFVQ